MTSEQITSNDKDTIQEVASWIHDEAGSCVTTQRIAYTFGISRKHASIILCKALSPTNHYQITHITTRALEREDGESKTNVSVIGLKQSSVPGNSDSIKRKMHYIYAASLLRGPCEEDMDTTAGRTRTNVKNSTPLSTIAQTDAILFRSQIDSGQSSLVLDFNAMQINPAVDMTERQELQHIHGRSSNNSTSNSSYNDNNGNGRKMTSAQPKNETEEKQATSAQSFFSKNNLQKKRKVTPQSISNSSAKSTPSTDNSSKNIQIGKKQKTSNKPKKKSFFESSTKVKSKDTGAEKSEQKILHPSSNTHSKKETNVGTADDFVGDEESDDEDLIEEGQRRFRNLQRKKEEEENALKLQKQKEERERQRKQEEEIKPSKLPVLGAKKRRRKLIERTTMDKKGYMHTETVAVWEEVDEDDEDSKRKTSGSLIPSTKPERKMKKSKGTTGMKQKSLTGFFSKKN